MDAKDILGLPKSLPQLTHEKKHHSRKDSHKRPDGISREVYALTGGLAPLIPTTDVSQLKKRNPSADKITWQWLPFTNSARNDNLQLFHWVKVTNGVPPDGDYPFAKYNKSVDVIRYTDEEYEKYLADPNWSKKDTDELFELCERFALRFIVIADRFSSSRTVEELKDRYYSVSRTIAIARAPSSADAPANRLVKEPYNSQQDIARKQALSLILSQTRQQERKDNEVLDEARRIIGSHTIANDTADFAEGQPNVDDDALSPSNDLSVSVEVDHSTILASLSKLPVYLRSHGFEQMVHAVSSSVGPRTMKRIEQTFQTLKVNLKPLVPTKAVCLEHLELRKEISTLLHLQKQLLHKDAEGASGLDVSLAAGIPSTSADRSFAPDPFPFGDSAERVARKEQKRKGSGRFTSSPSAHKRPRKMRLAEH